ncbi:MAG: ABC transporter ATP-binding protein [Caldilineaceae bacterium]|nr:ABC transporter ATP-binding protein [Caldilineaceae bacterium]
MSEVALSCRSVRKSFVTGNGPVLALDNLNVDLLADTFTAIVGPSGCGKSTLLHIIAGLDSDYLGELEWHTDNSRIGYLFQQPRLLPWMNIAQNVAFVLEPRGHSRSEATETAMQYLKLVGLEGFEQSYPTQLSGGMQQRAAMARALAMEPEVMLMDEPLGSLDELTARRMRAELLRLFEDRPRTVLFITHNVTEAAFLADQVIVMSGRPGRVTAQIPVDLPKPRDYDDPRIAAIAHEIVRNLHLDE